jgi:hypothetical protein
MNIEQAREAVQAFRRSALTNGFSGLLQAAETLLAKMEEIHAILDGDPNEPAEPWDSETIEYVANALTDFGYVIRSPGDEEEEEEEDA